MNKWIDYAAFIRLCRVEDPTEWGGGFQVRQDGAYVIVPADGVFHTPNERAALSWHPSGDHSRPALEFPATLSELQGFLDRSGNYGSIDAFEMADFVLENDSPGAAGTWPWGKHDTALLRAFASAGTLWMHYDPREPKTAPKAAAVVAAAMELQGRKGQTVSRNLATAMATILRADDLADGPRQRKG